MGDPDPERGIMASLSRAASLAVRRETTQQDTVAVKEVARDNRDDDDEDDSRSG